MELGLPLDVEVGRCATGQSSSAISTWRFRASARREQVRASPIKLTVFANDAPLRTLTLDKCATPIRVFEALDSVPRRAQIEVRIEVDHTVRVGADLRDLGVAIETIRIVP